MVSKIKKLYVEFDINKSTFNRGLNDDFIEALGKSAIWNAVKNDAELKPFIRENEVHVYLKGCKVCGIRYLSREKKLIYETHEKYLKENTDSQKYLKFDDQNYCEQLELDNPNITSLLMKIKHKTNGFTSPEKDNIHKIFLKEEALCKPIDVEIGFGGVLGKTKEGDTIKLHKRIDLATAKIENGEVEINFYEVKQYSYTSALRASDDKNAPVVAQLELYDELLEKGESSIKNTYEKIIKNFIALGIGDWKDFKDKDVIINRATKLIVTSVPKDVSEKSKTSWNKHLEKLENALKRKYRQLDNTDKNIIII